MLEFFIKGLILNAGLIVAIGAQNAFVLAQGLARRFVGTVAAVCSICDIILIAIGIGGGIIGKQAATVLTYAGAAYLFWLSAKAAKAAWKGDMLAAAEQLPQTRTAAIAAAVGLSLLNPHAILDMTVIFGGASASLEGDEKLAFAAGGALASILWFFGLGLCASKLAPTLSKPIAWRIINAGIAAIMFTIAVSLLFDV